ncbi:hypothetical protein QTP88_019267 [Uroleucon formosanum]
MLSKKNSSNVWCYFTKNINKPDEAKCNLCHTVYKHGHGTSNLHEHLCRKHQSKLDADKSKFELDKDLDLRLQQGEASTSTSKRSFRETTIMTINSINEVQVPVLKKQIEQLLLSKRFGIPSEKQKTDFVRSIVEMITDDLQPLSFVENSGFQNVIRLLDSRYLELLPGRRTLTRSILPEVYSTTKNKLQDILNKSSYISITSDIWTSLNTDSFMTITVHTFDSAFVLKTFVLCTLKLENSHTGEYLITDSGAKIKSAVKKLRIPHIPCTAHILNLIFTQALVFRSPYGDNTDNDVLEPYECQNLNDLLKKCRSIVTYLKKCELGALKLKLKQDVSTRWNSSLLMLERLVELKEPLTYAMLSLKDGPVMLNAQEWEVIEDAIPILKPFEVMINELSGENYSTLAMVIPLVRGLHISLVSKQMRTYLGQLLKQKLLGSLNSRFKLIEEQNPKPEFSRATLLDPRFKKLAFQHTINAENVEKSITDELSLLISENLNAIYKKKTFTYVPPTPPAELIEASNFTINFESRKFIQIGIDPTYSFKVVLLIITPSRYIRITPGLLKQIFDFMGHILSFILDPPQRYSRVTFFETDLFKLSSMVYGGENVLVLESKNREGCRVLLNRSDLIQLQYLESSIFETIVRKDLFTSPLVLKQIDEFAAYLEVRCSQEKSPPKNIEEMKMYIKNMQLDQADRVVQSMPNLSGQIQIYAATQLAETWENRKAQESCNVDSKILSPSCSPKLIISKLEDTILAKPLDHIDGPQSPSYPIRDGLDFFVRFDSPPSTYADHPTAAPLRGVKRRLPQSPASPQPFDVNDGPDFFNPISTSTPIQTTYTQHPARDVRQRLF